MTIVACRATSAGDVAALAPPPPRLLSRRTAVARPRAHGPSTRAPWACSMTTNPTKPTVFCHLVLHGSQSSGACIERKEIILDPCP